MRPCREVLLLLLLGLTRATTPVPDGSTPGLAGSTPKSLGSIPPSTPAMWAVSYEDAILAVLELLNTRAISPYILRLREVQPRPGWPSDLQHKQELSFTMEETSCPAPGMATTTCKTRWLGAVSWCQGHVFLEQHQPMVELSCEKIPITLGRIGTSKFKDFFARIKERLRSFFQCGRIWIRDKITLKNPKL